MEKERKIAAPEGCEIEKVEIVDGVAVVTFRDKKRELPKSWDEFCEMSKITFKECYIGSDSFIHNANDFGNLRKKEIDKNLFPERSTAEAVLALCQLIQLRDCYNGDWVPDWADYNQYKYTIEFHGNEIFCNILTKDPTILYFKSEELRNEFLRCFRPLIEKLKPLYGIKEGGEE